MNPVPDIYRILPEVVLSVTGVLVMLIDASLAPARSRRGLGWVAAVGTTVALWTSLWQLSLPAGTGFSETVESTPFTVFFHVLICGIVLVTLLLSLDTLPEDSHHQGEYYALITFGAVGMCLLTSAVELLVVFIALEISSISTYILARGYRKQTGRGPEAAIKYFLLGSFATGFLLYGIALVFGATGTTSVYEIARSSSTAQNQSLVHAALALMLVVILFMVSAAPFHVWPPDVYEGSPSPVVALMSTAPEGGRFRISTAGRIRNVSDAPSCLVSGTLDRRRSFDDRGQSGGTASGKRETHVGVLFHRPCRISACSLCRIRNKRNCGSEFLYRSLRCNECRNFRGRNARGRLQRRETPYPGLQGIDLPCAPARQPVDLFPRLARGNSLHRRILRQVLLLLGRRRRGRHGACHHRVAQLRIGGGLLSAGRFHRGAAP